MLHKSLVECQNRQAHKTPIIYRLQCAFANSQQKWLGLGLGFQFLWMIEEGKRQEQSDLSVALVLWAQNRRFRGVWVSDEMGGVVFWWVCLVKL